MFGQNKLGKSLTNCYKRFGQKKLQKCAKNFFKNIFDKIFFSGKKVLNGVEYINIGKSII